MKQEIEKEKNEQGANAPADTAKLPKIEEEKEGEKKKASLLLFGREVPKKAAYAVVGALCAVVIIGGGLAVSGTLSGQGDAKENTPALSQAKEESQEKMVLTLNVKADGWDADASTPIIAHIVSEDGEVDFYHAFVANERVEIEVGKAGIYTVTFLSPVNADGSIYKVADSKKVTAAKAGSGAVGTNVEFEKVEAADVTKEDLSQIAKDVAQGVKKGDKTLTKEAGEKVAKKYEDNLKQNANVDAAEVAKETEAAKETAREDKSEAKTPETSVAAKESGAASSTNSGNAGNSQTAASTASGANSSQNSGSTKNESPAHQHNWVAQTSTVHHDAVTHQEPYTIHHDAVTHQVWHDAVTDYRKICNTCGADITNDPWGHLDTYDHDSFHGAYVTVREGYNETVIDTPAYDETAYRTVTDQSAWDETVTTGYKCSGCGATK